jgi:hypothetical protein
MYCQSTASFQHGQEQAFTAEAARLAETQRLQELALEQQEKGEAPLPVVRLCFVGRGRAGKTTTLRRLKGESFQEDEPSTHGLDVWAGQVEADLQADLKKTHPWKRWEESMHLTALKDTCSFGLLVQYYEALMFFV